MSDNKRIFSSCFLPSLTSTIRTKRTSRRMNGSLFNFCNPPSDFSSVQAATAKIPHVEVDETPDKTKADEHDLKHDLEQDHEHNMLICI